MNVSVGESLCLRERGSEEGGKEGGREGGE